MGSGHLTANGMTMTVNAWARQEGVCVTGNTIRRRSMSGMSDYESIFGEKVTHKNFAPASIPCRYDEVRGVGVKG